MPRQKKNSIVTGQVVQTDDIDICDGSPVNKPKSSLSVWANNDLETNDLENNDLETNDLETKYLAKHNELDNKLNCILNILSSCGLGEREGKPIDVSGIGCPNVERVKEASTMAERIYCPKDVNSHDTPSLTNETVSLQGSQMRPSDLPKVELTYFDGNPLNYCKFSKQFEYYVEAKVTDFGQRMLYLLHYCKGKAREAIEDCIMLPPEMAYIKAREILQDLFGQPYRVARARIDNLLLISKRTVNTAEGLTQLSINMKSCSLALEQLHYEADLNSLNVMEHIVRGLPFTLQVEWSKQADGINMLGREPNFDELNDFIARSARIARGRFGQLVEQGQQQHSYCPTAQKPNRVKSDVRSIFATTSNTLSNCTMCFQTHSIDVCPAFLKLDVSGRWNFAKRNRLCFGCLRKAHRAALCHTSGCKIDNCNGKHHSLLHNTGINTNKVPEDTNNICAANTCTRNVRLGILPVIVETPIGMIKTHAFLDNGSDTTFIKRSFAEKCRLPTTPATLSIATLNGTAHSQCAKTTLRLRPLSKDDLVEVEEAYTIDSLPINRVAPVKRLKDEWQHLNDVVLENIDDDEVNLLIGGDVPDAHWVIEQKVGNRKQPFAVKTLLGWMIYGPLDTTTRSFATVSYISHSDSSINHHLERLYNHEFEDTSSGSATLSKEDKHALSTVENGVQFVKGHCQIPLPWRPNSNLSNNYPGALKRLMRLRSRLLHDDVLKQKYFDIMSRHINLRYIERVNMCLNHNHNQRIWYMPHHPVMNPKKPDKIRIVFDCAARHGGDSLNDHLLQGPDLTAKLIEVLLRFRTNVVAVTADIEEMFLQVGVPDSDRDALRILWWNQDDLNDTPAEYRMTVHPFGAKSSPFCANFALRKVSELFGQAYVENVRNAVHSFFYVDDCLASLPNETAAISFVHDLTEMLSKGGFRLTKWISNKEKVTESIPPSERRHDSKEIKLSNPPSQATLGLQWDTQNDEFIIKFCLPKKPLTRRGILSAISSLYDPLGFVSPWILRGKMILQDICRKKLGWDEPIDISLSNAWHEWLENLNNLGEIRIQRCIKPEGLVSAPELHLFSDASEVGYGAVAYVRYDCDGINKCCLLFSKARVAPLKVVSIPRLELTAATLAVRIAQTVCHSTGIEFKQVTYWCDSMIVMYYIKNIKTRFSTFVANKLSYIHDHSTPEQWKHVRTANNPADHTSRGLSRYDEVDEWLAGPTFLRHSKETWKNAPLADVNMHEVEFKNKTVTCNATNKKETWQFPFMLFSCWYKCLKSIAWLCRYKRYLIIMHTNKGASSLRVGHLTCAEIKEAMCCAVRLVQMEAFADEMTHFSNDYNSENDRKRYSGKLKKLNPFMVGGVLRANGRLSNSEVPFNVKYPMILPSKHHVTNLIVNYYHRIDAHAGKTHVLSIIRQNFWILRSASVIKGIIGRCVPCQRYNAALGKQLMSPLPPVRIEPGWHPFSHIGLDYFGPIQVKRGRTVEKRYGCIITCLKSRAVHLEVAHSLSTDSFLLLLTRFIGRRGIPSEIYSDNGSNFVGAQSELKKWITELNSTAINSEMLKKGIDWHFQPPYASHRGGVWERLIRSIRRMINVMCVVQTPDDETLLTTLIEIERILNDRPIVPLVSDDIDSAYLSPNHLLLLRSNDGLPIKDTMVDRYTSRWKRTRYLASVFWKRWTREYLPILQTRQKWINQHRNFKVGDVVLVSNESLNRKAWPLGLVIECFSGSDHLVRKVNVRTKSGVVLRDIHQLCLLEGAQQDPHDPEEIKDTDTAGPRSSASGGSDASSRGC